jgi:uncharacterized protein YndB with AHSA1/START domain
MQELPYRLDRTVVIKAAPETVFRFFTDSARWASWWGAGSTIDATPGGKMYIRHPNGVESLGEVLEVLPPERIAFTYGFASGKPIPPGSSRVTISLQRDQAGTRLHLLTNSRKPRHAMSMSKDGASSCLCSAMLLRTKISLARRKWLIPGSAHGSLWTINRAKMRWLRSPPTESTSATVIASSKASRI